MENLRNRKHKQKVIKEETKTIKTSEFHVKSQKESNGHVQESNYCTEKNQVNQREDDGVLSLKIPATPQKRWYRIHLEINLFSLGLFLCGLLTRMYKLDEPRNIVFDELHYGKYVSMYMKNTFFFDTHPPLGKQLIAAVAYLVGFDGRFKFDRIGSPYPDSVPLLALRFVPAFFGSLIIPTTYHLMLELGLTQWTSLLAAILLLFDNALLTQSRFILMESMLIFFALFGILCILKFRQYSNYNLPSIFWLVLACFSLTCSLCVKYVGFYSYCLGLVIIGRDFWRSLAAPNQSDWVIFVKFLIQSCIIATVSILVYLSVFYIHLQVLYKAGPHDSIMTSAFQASLDGGLASITKGQPLLVAHGSQVTLRHTHGRTCWLHSHNHVYPIRYPDKRGSSHQQQVTCYSFKDVNNWWIVKRPNKNDLVVEQPIDVIKHGDVIQLVHGITSRALNSHDVAAPISPQSQEVSCYIDYNVSMPAQNLWRVDILNREQNGDDWHTIQSLVRLIHIDTNTALKFSGRQLPDWGFHQHEVVADRIINQDDTVWNVEEHRYTKSEDQKDRERELVTAEMIPTAATSLTFWEKFFELHYKMMFSGSDGVQNHMYSSEPLEWPLLSRGIAYWVSSTSNAQIHLIGNLLLWYSGTIAILIYTILLVFYLLRRRRLCFDLNEKMWQQFQTIGGVFLTGYLIHYLPYFFVERTLFLHHYLPAFTFKTLLLAALFEHLFYLIRDVIKIKMFAYFFIVLLTMWVVLVFYVFTKFLVLSYGTTPLTTNDMVELRWKDTWDFIVHKN